jgi:serine-type D-Ala-D-Ala carboxypeptidase/endopeptidase (penicillin-binding protein 4)
VRFLWRWLLPVLLVIGSAACVLVGLRLDSAAADPTIDALDQGRVVTPLLSARRIPTIVAAPVATQRLQADLAEWIGGSPAQSCLVVAAGEGERLFGHRGEVSHVPASAQKLLTAAAALVELGPDHRYRTLAASTTEPVEGTLEGDLFLVGGGDPILATADYAARFRRQPQLFTDLGELADAIVDAGVRRIDGAVVGDERRYDRTRYVPGWPERYIAQGQIGPLSGLSVNDGFAEYPPAPDAPGEPEPAEDPAAEAAEVLVRLLRDRGVEVTGESRSGDAPEGVQELASLESPPLLEITGQLLRESDNNTGELVLKELGLVRAGEGSTETGTAAVTAAVADVLGDADGVEAADGSGLSLDNRVSCDVLVELLEHRRLGPPLVDGLAVAGESGTLQERFGGELTGRLKAKTGSLNTVTALAGVVDDDDGRLTFAYLANVAEPSVIGPSTIALQDGLAQILLGWPRTPDVSVLGPQAPDLPEPAPEGGP